MTLLGTPDASRFRLMAVLDREWFDGRTPGSLAASLIEGGATVIQYRDKVSGVREMIEIADILRKTTADAGVPLIVNDRLDVALASGADGIHVGWTDMPADRIRRIAPDLCVGFSVSSVEEFEAAPDADYYGVGACFPTGTKTVERIPGPGLLTELRPRTTRPLVAIGGIHSGNAGEAIRSGADGIAAVSAFLGEKDIRKAVRAVKAAIEGGVR
ncbi:thiamine phosphate synthase [bacterium]|nr:thiamine phosphate synthase [bacterium]